MKINWGKALIAGVVMEILFVVYVRVILESSGVQNSVPGLTGAFLLMFAGGAWVMFKADTIENSSQAMINSLINGALVGVVAMLLYFILVIGVNAANGNAFEFPGFTWNHLTKIVGGALGGLLVGAMISRKSA